MFIGKELRSVKTGKQILVPFCNECNSQNIETIQVCRNCGSHNIKVDWQDDRSIKDEYEDRCAYIYKCDSCGEEYDGLQHANVISYSTGEFISGESEYSEKKYSMKRDLCPKCTKMLINTLNARIEEIIDEDNVMNIADNITDKTETKESEQCQTCAKYEYCTMRKDKEFCYEYDREGDL
jgi:hypothetical protein